MTNHSLREQWATEVPQQGIVGWSNLPIPWPKYWVSSMGAMGAIFITVSMTWLGIETHKRPIDRMTHHFSMTLLVGCLFGWLGFTIRWTNEHGPFWLNLYKLGTSCSLGGVKDSPDYKIRRYTLHTHVYPALTSIGKDLYSSLLTDPLLNYNKNLLHCSLFHIF